MEWQIKIRKIIENIENIPDGDPKFEDKRYKAYSISENNFHEFFLDEKVNICAIDGGNAEVFFRPELSIHFVRIYFNLFNVKRLGPSKKFEYYVVAYACGEGGKITYKTETIPLNSNLCLKNLSFDSYDERLRRGEFRAEISLVPKIIRKFLEWLVVKEAVKVVGSGGIILKDGSLQTGYPYESVFAKEAWNIAKNKVRLMALSKRSNLYTTTGKNLSDVLFKMGEKILRQKMYYYYPIVEIEHPDHQAKMLFVKLHQHAERLFRLEIHNSLEIDNTILSSLAANSKDPRFLGYPYPLIEADRVARISERERLHHKNLLSSLFSSKKDPHEILDMLFR